MATKYTHSKVGSNYEIQRNGEQVATFDPITEEVAYVGEGKKFAVPIGKEVTTITDADAPADAPAETSGEVSTKELTKALTKANKYIASLEGEIRDLRNDQRGGGNNTTRVPDRYKGIPTNPKGAPVQTPHQGDLTPEFVAWAREGGYTKEQFLQVYSGRIKDLTYPAPKKEKG